MKNEYEKKKKLVIMTLSLVALCLAGGLGFYLSNRRLSQVISADYFRRKHLSQSAVNEAKAHYIGCHRRLSRAYFSSAMAGLK